MENENKGKSGYVPVLKPDAVIENIKLSRTYVEKIVGVTMYMCQGKDEEINKLEEKINSSNREDVTTLKLTEFENHYITMTNFIREILKLAEEQNLVDWKKESEVKMF